MLVIILLLLCISLTVLAYLIFSIIYYFVYGIFSTLYSIVALFINLVIYIVNLSIYTVTQLIYYLFFPFFYSTSSCITTSLFFLAIYFIFLHNADKIDDVISKRFLIRRCELSLKEIIQIFQ